MGIVYTTELTSPEQLHSLYESLDWNQFLQLSKEQLKQAMEQSFYVIYAYDGDTLVGTGRVISDGVINAILCGVGVHPSYRGQRIGLAICRKLIEYCQRHRLHIQLLCKEELIPFYNQLGFEVFTVGMKL